MKNIDFLPDIYRQREALRKARVWWGIVVVVFGSAIAAAAGSQAWLRHRLEAELAELEPQFSAAQAEVRELAALQSHIVLAGHEANLFTYLEHPWPRTQILAAVVQPLPPRIRLTKIHLLEQEVARQAAPQAGPRRSPQEESASARMLPAEQDLVRLKQDMDRRETIVELTGTTADVPALHEYVGELQRSPLVAAAQIKSLEAATRDALDQNTRFILRIVIQPGYGQGPTQRPPLATSPKGLKVLGGHCRLSLRERTCFRGAKADVVSRSMLSAASLAGGTT